MGQIRVGTSCGEVKFSLSLQGGNMAFWEVDRELESKSVAVSSMRGVCISIPGGKREHHLAH